MLHCNLSSDWLKRHSIDGAPLPSTHQARAWTPLSSPYQLLKINICSLLYFRLAYICIVQRLKVSSHLLTMGNMVQLL